MRNKYKARLRQKNAEFKKYLETAYEYFNEKYPGWENGKKDDVNHIKKRLHQTAKLWQKNIKKKKTKVLHKRDFKEWPFTDDTIIIVQTSKKMISCIINFKEYALNGLAATDLKLKFSHDCKKAIIGKSVSEFIKIGLEL
jgi:hypothetical protein